MTAFYVTIDGERVEGPFDDRASAKRVADDLNTHDVGARYRVEKSE